MDFKKNFFLIFLVLLLIFCCWLYINAEFENKNHPPISGQIKSTTIVTPTIISATTTETINQNQQLFPVSRVIDGDTIVVLMDGREETIRLLGMDTPETVDPRKPVQCFGVEASNETKSLLDGREVTLQSDPTQSDRDKYGRLLRYVFRDDGLFVDEYLVKEGFAYEYTYFGLSYKYQIKFRTDQKSAQSVGLGLWATSTCDGKR